MIKNSLIKYEYFINEFWESVLQEKKRLIVIYTVQVGTVFYAVKKR